MLRHRTEDPRKPFQESPLIARQVPVAMARPGFEPALSACSAGCPDVVVVQVIFVPTLGLSSARCHNSHPHPCAGTDRSAWRSSTGSSAQRGRGRHRSSRRWCCAQAALNTLELDTTGFDRFVIAAADTVMSRSNSKLVAEVFPDLAATRELGELDMLLSIEKARRVLGYSPLHSWR